MRTMNIFYFLLAGFLCVLLNVGIASADVACTLPLQATNGIAPATISFEETPVPVFPVKGAVTQTVFTERYVVGKKSLQVVFTTPNSEWGVQSIEIPTVNKLNFSAEYLDFFVYPVQGSGLTVMIRSATENVTFPVDAYALNGFYLGKWNHIRIPLIGVTDTLRNAGTNLSFIVDSSYVNVLPDTEYTFFFDGIGTATYNDQLSMFARRYCAARVGPQSTTPEWQFSLDSPVFQSTCELYPVFNWTGTRCCGETLDETYGDTLRGCYQSSNVSNGTPIYPVITYTINSKEFTTACFSSTCIIPFPTHKRFSQIDSTGMQQLTDVGGKYKVTLTTPNNAVQINFPSGNSYTNYSGDRVSITLINPSFVYGSVTPASTGAFYYCSASANSQFPSFQNLYPSSWTQDMKCPSVGEYVCSTAGAFAKKLGPELYVKNSFSNSPLCCEKTSCNSGNACVRDQIDDANPTPTLFNNNNYYCINGQWTNEAAKSSFDNSSKGYCPQSSMCLIKRGECISSGSVYRSYYCDSGKWVSKIAVLAYQMQEYAIQTQGVSAGYSLHCDTANETLNYLGILSNRNPVGGGNLLSVEEIFNGRVSLEGGVNRPLCSTSEFVNDNSCVDRFCVLKPADASKKILIGVVLLDNLSKSKEAGLVFDLTCDTTTNPSQFVQCISNKTWFYNTDMQLLMYVPAAAPSSSSWFFSTLDGIKNWFASLFGGFSSQAELKPLVPNQSSVFNRLYLNTNSGKNVIGYSEILHDGIRYQKRYVVSYNDALRAGNSVCAHVATVSGLLCVSTADNKTSTIVGNEQSIDLWPSLTAQLRVP